MTNVNNNEDFSAAVGDVERHQPTARVVSFYQTEPSPGLVRRREAATERPDNLDNLSGGADEYAAAGVEPLEPMAIVAFCQASVKNSVYRNLRQGKYAPEAGLDLHHQTVAQARSLVFEFVQDCTEQKIRCAVITHGKGEGRAQPARLKSCVAHWLPQLDDVLACHSAVPKHGGAGATYILLKRQ